jgi:hypothetical protein
MKQIQLAIAIVLGLAAFAGICVTANSYFCTTERFVGYERMNEQRYWFGIVQQMQSAYGCYSPAECQPPRMPVVVYNQYLKAIEMYKHYGGKVFG